MLFQSLNILGWDYSSRWMEEGLESNDDELLSVQTGDILPVDLNSFLCRYFYSQCIIICFLDLSVTKNINFSVTPNFSLRCSER